MKDGVIFQPLSPAQQEAAAVFASSEIVFLLGPAGTGKAQPLDSVVWTPLGPVPMGHIRVGSRVCTPNGGVANVIGVFPQGEKAIYRLHFSDGSSVESCKDHLWKISCHNERAKVVPLREMLGRGAKTPNGRNRFSIAVPQPLYFEEQPICLDPYLVGILIGDGSLTNANVAFSTADEEIVASVVSSLDPSVTVKKTEGSYNYRITKDRPSCKPNYVKNFLRHYDMMGCYAYDKFIPSQYLFNSIENRLALLQGLMDTDGTVNRQTGQATFYTVSPRLAHDFRTLIESLGGICTINLKHTWFKHRGQRRRGRLCYVCNLAVIDPTSCFRLARKKMLARRRVKYFPKRILTGITFSRRALCQCILIDSPDHLYLTNHCVVTHNTHCAVALALRSVLGVRDRKVLLSRPMIECGEEMGFLPGSVEEKFGPWLGPIQDVLGQMTFSKLDQLPIEVCPLAYMRGRTVRNAVAILDEAQNCSYEQLKMFLTRLGEKGKLILTGDLTQVDRGIRGGSGLRQVVEALEGLEGVGIIQMPASGIVRHPLLARILERLPA